MTAVLERVDARPRRVDCAGRTGLAVSYPCAGHDDHVVWFRNPLDGGEAPSGFLVGHPVPFALFTRVGDDPRTLSVLEPLGLEGHDAPVRITRGRTEP